jgi:hypothetical protein
VKKLALVLSLAMLLFAAACGVAEDAQNTAFDVPTQPHVYVPRVAEYMLNVSPIFALSDLLLLANQRRAAIVRPDAEAIFALMDGHTPNPAAMWDFVTPNHPRIAYLPLADAVADIYDFFGLMRDIYGGYLYFGGDGVFVPIRDAVLAELGELGEVVRTDDMARILQTNLSLVINDRHFVLDGEELGRGVNFFVGDAALNASPQDEFAQLFVGEDGQFYYNIVVPIASDASEYVRSVTLADGTSQDVRLLRHTFSEQPAMPPTLAIVEGIPVVTMRFMTFESYFPSIGGGTQLDATNTFLSIAEEIRNAPVAIMDLRGNPGGSAVLPLRWLYSLTDEIVPPNSVQFGVRIDYEDVETPTDTWWYVSEKNMHRYLPLLDLENGFFTRETPPDILLEREQLLIILTDRSTASAAEFFVDLTMNITNTLVIGTNTAGMLNFGSNQVKTLYRSGMPFVFGTQAYVWPYGHLPESVGLSPDIWTVGCALTAALSILGKGAGYEN